MIFEIGSHSGTTCLGGRALKILNYDTPVNVVCDDPVLGSNKYLITSGEVVYRQPYT